MQTVRGKKRYVADLEVGDVFFHNWDRRWVRVTQTYKHPQSPYNKIHVDALDGSYENLYVKLYLTMSVAAKPRISMQQKEADTRAVALCKAVDLANTLKIQLSDYAAIHGAPEDQVMVMGVQFNFELLRREVAERIRATQSQLANLVKQL